MKTTEPDLDTLHVRQLWDVPRHPLGKEPVCLRMWEFQRFRRKHISEAEVLKVPPIFLRERLDLAMGEKRCQEE